MANTTVVRNIEGFTDQWYNIVLEYDFANDAGATGTLSMGTFKQKTLIRKGYAFIETACTSGGSATVVLGASAADPNGILDASDGAVANLTDNAVVFTASTSDNLVVPADETFDMTIGTAALTAGKIKVHLECINVE